MDRHSKLAIWGKMDSWKREYFGSLISPFFLQARWSNCFMQLDFLGCFHNPLLTMETCSCYVSLFHLTPCSNQPNLSAALLKVVQDVGSLHSTARGHSPGRTGKFRGARSKDTLYLPVKPQWHMLQRYHFKAFEREPFIMSLTP